MSVPASVPDANGTIAGVKKGQCCYTALFLYREGEAFGSVGRALDGQGFGERDPSKTFTDQIENVSPEYRKLGAKAEFVNEAGESLSMVVIKLDACTATLDGKHPFAGKTVTFHIRVEAVRDAIADELVAGRAALRIAESSCRKVWANWQL